MFYYSIFSTGWIVVVLVCQFRGGDQWWFSCWDGGRVATFVLFEAASTFFFLFFSTLSFRVFKFKLVVTCDSTVNLGLSPCSLDSPKKLKSVFSTVAVLVLIVDKTRTVYW